MLDLENFLENSRKDLKFGKISELIKIYKLNIILY